MYSSSCSSRCSPKSGSSDFLENLRQDEEVFKLISDCLPETQEDDKPRQCKLSTPVKDNALKSKLIPPLTCVKEDNEESEPSQNAMSPSHETSTERKGFYAVKQPSLVSTGTFVVPETLTVSSPDAGTISFPVLTRFMESSEQLRVSSEIRQSNGSALFRETFDN